jgi:hypothetical protein
MRFRLKPHDPGFHFPMKSSTGHFSRVAPAYASCRPEYPESLFDYLFSLVQGRDLAWHCGAGTGQATLPEPGILPGGRD